MYGLSMSDKVNILWHPRKLFFLNSLLKKLCLTDDKHVMKCYCYLAFQVRDNSILL